MRTTDDLIRSEPGHAPRSPASFGRHAMRVSGSQRSVRIVRIFLYYLICNAFCLFLMGYGRVKFHQILNLKGDDTQVLDFAKSYIDGFGFRFNPKQGYPGSLDNVYFPTFDFMGRFLLMIFGRFTKSAEISLHLLYVSGICLMTSGALFGFSKLSIRPWLGFVAACAFVATPFFASRALGHDFLALYYGAAFGGTICILVASLDREQTVAGFLCQPSTWVCLWFAATSGIYYAFFTCMFTCVGGLMNAGWHRRWTPLIVTSLTVAIILPTMMLTGYGTGIIDVLAGRVPQVSRASFEQISLGLNPAEAVASLAAIPGLAWTLGSYEAVLPSVMGVKGLYEWPSAVICLVIFSAPVAVGILSRGEQPGRVGHWLQLIQIAALFIIFGFVYAVRGGIAYYFNIFVSSDIRGTDRIMPFLTFFAIVVLCAVVETALRLRRTWLGWSISIAIVAALAFGAWPHAGAIADKQKLILSDRNRMASIESTRRMLLAKDAAGITAVLQLPHVPWPEHPPVRDFDAYDHEDAYILDRARATTRWSYGSAASQAAFKSVQALVAGNPVSGLDQGARDMGFDAILVEKAAYDKDDLARLQSNIESGLGGGCKVFDDVFRVLYSLRRDAGTCEGAPAPSGRR